MNYTNLSLNILRWLGALFGVAVLGEALLQALIHLHDLSQISHMAGVWMTLAQSLRDGVFYPPLEQNGYYAGTRYMPLYFLLLAGLAKLTGDYLLAAKLTSLLAMLGLLAAVFAAARRITGRRLDAFILASAILAFPEVRRALLSPHADALAVALSVGGLALLGNRHRGRILLGTAALLFALALSAKITSIAAGAAACVFLFRRERRQAIQLAVLLSALILAGFVLLQLCSEGRFLDNFRAVGSGGLRVGSLLDGPVRLMQALVISTQQNFVTPLLLLPATVALLNNALERRFSLWDWYFLFTFGTTIFIFTSPGTDLNHLLELEVAGVFVLAGWLRQQVEEPAEALPSTELVARAAVTAALLCGLVFVGLFWSEGPAEDAIPARTLTDALPANGSLLTEDATVAILQGRRPVVMDPFDFRILAESGRIDPEPLVERIRRREFAVVVLLRDINDLDGLLNQLLLDKHWGKQVTEAIRESYRFERQIGAYYLYKPK